jgi:azurin
MSTTSFDAALPIKTARSARSVSSLSGPSLTAPSLIARAIALLLMGVPAAVFAQAPAQTAAKAPAKAATPAAAVGQPPAEGPCVLRVGGNDLMQYDKKELRAASSCKTVTVVLVHTGKLPAAAMGHNFVLTRTADVAAVAAAGLAAGMKNHHVPPNDKRVLASSSKLVGKGEWVAVDVPMAGLQKGGDYTYFCTFPGHSGIMKGKFIVT